MGSITITKSDWLKQGEVADIQTAIQSQTIQTALERNTSGLTDQAFQSYLTNAPIPRYWYNQETTALPTGANTTCTWGGSFFDPYSMVAATGIVTVPLDGFYICTMGFAGTAPAGGGFDIGFMDPGKTFWYAREFGSQYPPSPGNYGCTITMHTPLRAGTQFLFTFGNGTTGNMGFVTGVEFSGTWVSPYQNYKGGQ